MNWFENLNPAIQALIATIFTWGITALGSLTVYFFRTVNQKEFRIIAKIDFLTNLNPFTKKLKTKIGTLKTKLITPTENCNPKNCLNVMSKRTDRPVTPPTTSPFATTNHFTPTQYRNDPKTTKKISLNFLDLIKLVTMKYLVFCFKSPIFKHNLFIYVIIHCFLVYSI